MGAVRWLGPVLLALAVVWLVAGGGCCAREAGPQLVQVLDVAPREVEVGDRVAIVGEGFPSGKPARVTFRGTLHRPGERAERGAEIVTMGTVVGAGQVELSFGEATQALFCGAGDRAVHTTFDGELEVAFTAAASGAPPIAGVLQHVTFDVRPGATASDREGDRDGERVLAWIGLEAAAGANGLIVESVAPGSRADAAGIAVGDVLASFDGVRIATAGDVVPAPGEGEASVGVRHASAAAEAVHTVSVDGFRRAPPAELLGAALILLAALVIVLLFGAPARTPPAATAQRVVSRMRARVGASPFSPTTAWARLARGLSIAARDALPAAGAPAVVDVLACALLAAMPFGEYLVAAQLDVGLLFVAAATALVGAALVASGSAWRGLRAAAHIAWQHAPAAAAVASVVVTTGSLRVQEIEHAQGGWPWDWLAFRSPAALVALVLLLACASIEADGPEASGLRVLMEQAPAAPSHDASRGPWLAAACRAHRILVAGLASALFLGGWLLPGLTASEQDGRPSLELAGAAWLLLKTWGVVMALACSRWALPRVPMAERSRVTAVWLAPLSAATLVATAAWTWWSPARAAQLLVSGTLVVGVALAALALARRLRHGLLSPTADGHLNPFL